MRTKWTIQLSTLISFLVLALASTEAAQAQSRPLQHTVSARVPSVVRILPDLVAVGPTGIPVFRVVTNDPALRRRLEQGPEGGLVAEALAADFYRGADSPAAFRVTVVSP